VLIKIINLTLTITTTLGQLPLFSGPKGGHNTQAGCCSILFFGIVSPIQIQSLWNHKRWQALHWLFFVETLIMPRDISLTHPQRCYQTIFIWKVAWHCCCRIINNKKFISYHQFIFFIWIKTEKPDWQSKSNFENWLSLMIQSTKLDCNPDWALHRSNQATPCTKVWLYTNVLQSKLYSKMTTVNPFDANLCRLFFHWWRLIFSLEIVDDSTPHR